MKRNVIIFILALTTITLTHAQKYMTKEGVIDIFSETSLFTIEAKNQKVASVLNLENGEIVASTLVLSFKFREALVEEHFNENYMESHLYPKAVFKGTIQNFDEIDFSKSGTYKAILVGTLTMHGQTRDITEEAQFTVDGTKISATSSFDVSLANYQIQVEEKYKDRIKDDVRLDIKFEYKKL